MTPDRISNLPLSVIETILTLMPMRDAFGTSILSRKWRYYCINIPKLHFHHRMLQRSSDGKLFDKHRFFYVVCHVLLLHHDPVLEFSLSFVRPGTCYEIDRIILYLSRNTTLQKFTLYLGPRNQHRLPSTFFSLQKLTHLKLRNCEIQPQSFTCGFSMLTNLWFDTVNITMSTLLKFLQCCPVLKSFSLINPIKIGNSNFFEIFSCLLLIEYLHFDYTFAQLFTFGITLERQLPNMLPHLRVLKFVNRSFSQEDNLHYVLLLITSSPNIEKINLEMYFGSLETSENPFDLHDYSNVILNNLREMEITYFWNSKLEMDFVKFILSNSPMLRTLRIEIDDSVSDSDELKILRDLLWIPRASTRAHIKFERPCY